MAKNSNSNANTAKTLYKGSVITGRVIGYFQGFIMLIGAIFMITFGIYLITKKDHMTETAIGIVTEVREDGKDKDGRSIWVHTYCFDSKHPDTPPANEGECDCRGNDRLVNIYHPKNTNVYIKYNPNDCNKNKLADTMKMATAGKILLGFGIVFLLITILHIYLLRNYPLYASFTTLKFLFGSHNNSSLIFPSINIY